MADVGFHWNLMQELGPVPISPNTKLNQNFGAKCLQICCCNPCVHASMRWRFDACLCMVPPSSIIHHPRQLQHGHGSSCSKAIVKNTFLELPSDEDQEDQPRKLRTVHTVTALEL